MLRKTQTCLPATIRLIRLFASKRKKAQVRRETGNIHMKNLFEAQRIDDSSKGGKPQANSYRAMLDRRHDQALRSVLIRVPMSTHDVCDSLLALGPVKKAFILQKLKNYLLVEFKHKATVDKLLQHTSYFPDASQIPLASRLLYAMQTFHVQRYTSGNSIVPEVVHKRELTTENYLAADSVSSQMQDLHSERQMSDVGSRLRFFMCSLMEDVVGNSMPFCRVQPFGSSSNGFGWEGCDLDMMMSFDPPVSRTQASSKFRFMTKRGSEDERVFGQQCLDVVGEMIRGVMPSTYAVNKVLNARVPIVKFRHEATELDCDLSYFNISGTKMSELMYLLGEVDPRVRTLMTTIKQWAKSCDLTRSHPGPWPSSFTLLSLLIVFLQTRSPCVLPSLRHLQSLAGAEDHFIIDGVDYAFVTDLSKVARSNNTQCIDELLVEFFHFYSHFDFSSQGLSLIEGSSFPKHDDNPMYIENPLDIGHNISSNVNTAYVGRLQEAMTEAVQCLESNSSPNPDKPWGLLCLFQPPSLVRSAQSAAGYNVTGLFEDGGRADG